MTDYKEYAKQMRENAVKNEQGNIVCSPELWEEIASVIERAIVPPCKVGDTVYALGYDEESPWRDEYKVKYFYCSSKGINRSYIECGTMGNNFRPKDIGKTVFLTKEEAEQTLKELK